MMAHLVMVTKFEVEGSGASITKDPDKPLDDLPMGLRTDLICLIQNAKVFVLMSWMKCVF